MYWFVVQTTGNHWSGGLQRPSESLDEGEKWCNTGIDREDGQQSEEKTFCDKYDLGVYFSPNHTACGSQVLYVIGHLTSTGSVIVRLIAQ